METTEAILLEIRDALIAQGQLDDKQLAQIIRSHNKNLSDSGQHHAKKKLMPYYLEVKRTEPKRWARWNISGAVEKQLLATLQVKPRRTASGVATISVITKPQKCSSDCLYCPNDLRMPKSYLSDEPACQRAERNFFDPYLQVSSRLRTLTEMGHPTDKIELIVLGGTWSDYPEAYQIWFITELFRALNEAGIPSEAENPLGAGKDAAGQRREFYLSHGLSSDEAELKAFVHKAQQDIMSGKLTYNQAVAQLYGNHEGWQAVAHAQKADFDELAEQHHRNETAQHRVVGLVIETRPDAINTKSLILLRRLGCTKIQMGIQSIDADILRKNNRNISVQKIQEAFELLRLFGFKIHAHFMLNLYGSTPAADKQAYQHFVSEPAYIPDEVKLYPCALVEGTRLGAHYADGSWLPYSEEELVAVLSDNVLSTPPFVRISRMIRDISAKDIVAGNKKTNLRQLVERTLEEGGAKRNRKIQEIRYREISTSDADIPTLSLETLLYETTATDEYFLQWVTPENRIAGFLRLSLPKKEYLRARLHEHKLTLPIAESEAMIREVHIYGRVAELQGAQKDADNVSANNSAQHLGLGKQLIETACNIAKTQGYKKMNVISSVGTREYYRNLGFVDKGLYQQISLS
ncbi:MAG: tRNA uridine(34) 5-carboxymethylaminomethyl modification radical SAM/GNAT enzyme Elp3 [Coriobacteriales bacterium]|jgi:elongator complex protein 3|nr:tRNA uridine(34) 5-carboxymethylaminomethyl modification radical SAM/GNAT enzyme Elp3 [Coriobacteriales bacterium]